MFEVGSGTDAGEGRRNTAHVVAERRTVARSGSFLLDLDTRDDVVVQSKRWSCGGMERWERGRDREKERDQCDACVLGLKPRVSSLPCYRMGLVTYWLCWATIKLLLNSWARWLLVWLAMARE